MLSKNNRVLGLYSDRVTHQWVVRDPAGNLWRLPPSEDGCWEQRLPFEFMSETDLESVPGHYKNEYFHGDNGAELGASHQPGWTGLVAKFIQLFGSLDAKRALEGGKPAGFQKQEARR